MQASVCILFYSIFTNVMQQLKDIKRLYRLYMNGIVSQSMRNKGAEYRVNFGLTMPLLRRIAEQVSPSAEVAEMLWQDRGVRESLLLAPMLYPTSDCTREVALRWGEEMPNTEVADFCCKFLFSQLSFAPQLVVEWVEAESELLQYTGFRLAYSLLVSDVDAEWLHGVATKAVDVAYSASSVAASSARRMLTESMLQPATGRVVVDVVRQSSHIDEQWRESIVSLYDGAI